MKSEKEIEEKIQTRIGILQYQRREIEIRLNELLYLLERAKPKVVLRSEGKKADPKQKPGKKTRGRPTPYTEEVLKFLQKQVNYVSIETLVKLLKKKFSIETNKDRLAILLGRHNISRDETTKERTKKLLDEEDGHTEEEELDSDNVPDGMEGSVEE